MRHSLPTPVYTTQWGEAHVGDSLDLLPLLPPESVDLVTTSPPFALQRKKEYGNETEDTHVEWLPRFAEPIHRLLKPTGSFVLDLGGAYQSRRPVRSLYNFRVMLRLCDEHGFHLAEEFFWHNPAMLPAPIEWVNKRKIRAKDSVNTVWWFSKTEHPKADVRRVLVPYSERMQKLLQDAASFYRPKKRPSGHDIGANFANDNGGAIPSNLLQIPNTESNSSYLRHCAASGVKPHAARFPEKLPSFFIEFLTDPGDTVLDIFAGSNTTGSTAEKLGRRWLAFEKDRAYLAASAFRFVDKLPAEELATLWGRLLGDDLPVRITRHQPELVFAEGTTDYKVHWQAVARPRNEVQQKATPTDTAMSNDQEKPPPNQAVAAAVQQAGSLLDWAKQHLALAGTYNCSSDKPPDKPEDQRRHIEPWLSALFQAEHLNLLVGSGLTNALAHLAGVKPADMEIENFSAKHADAVEATARESAKATGRGEPNFEDQIRAAQQLIEGLRVLGRSDQTSKTLLEAWEKELNERLLGLVKAVLATERGLAGVLEKADDNGKLVRRYLCSFLLSFASRAATRERLHVFTTNYDRLLEHGCDLLGLRVLDRFVGRLKPVFRSSRLGVDMHYNPPGIRGEPRYLEGVVRLTKLHGSLDWRQEGPAGETQIVRVPLPFGASEDHPDLPANPVGQVLVYPSPAKDMETTAYPYADLFRDFAAAICQPNSVLVTYGYGFGDDHINRMLRDMLTIPSSHLAIISWDNAPGRIQRFVESLGSLDQVTLLIGSHFGDLKTLVDHYLPKSAIDRTTLRMVELVNRRLRNDELPDRRNQRMGMDSADDGPSPTTVNPI